jgi:UDP-glucose-4-epimerase GalE
MEPVLVTGGAGYVGSHACKALHAAGFRPIVLDDLSRGHEWAVKWGPLHRCDLSDTARVEAVLAEYRPRAVLHFAGLIEVGESVRRPLHFYDMNVGGLISLLKAMAAQGTECLVFSSTAAVYGTPHDVPIREDHPLLPISPYGWSKLMAEQVIRDSALSGTLRYVTLRYFNAAGADPDGEIGEAHRPETHLIPNAVLSALGRRGDFTLFGTDYPTRDGTAIRDFIHVADLAEAHVAAVRHLHRGGESLTVNVGTGRGHSVSEVLAEIGRAAGRSVPVVECDRRAGDPPSLVADPSAAERLLGWRAARELADIIATAMAWHRHDR